MLGLTLAAFVGLGAIGPVWLAAASGDTPVVEGLLNLRRKRLAQWKKDIADLRKKAGTAAAREKSLKSKIAGKKKQLSSHRANAQKIQSERKTILDQGKETSGTLAASRQTEAALAARVAQLGAGVCTRTLELRVAQSPATRARDSLVLHLAALQAESAEKERERLAALIQQNENTQQDVSGDLAKADQRHRTADAAAEKLAAEIRQLEKERESARKSRQACLSRIAQLGKLSKSLEKEVANLEARQSKVAEAPKPTSDKPPATAPKPTAPSDPPRVPLSARVKEGTGYDLMVAEGADVHAIGAGRVLYAGRFPGYGNLVIVEHPDGVLSLYGFLSETLVASGRTVARAHTLGRSGFIEDRDRAGLRFEMRVTRGGREMVIDPKSWLPPGTDMKRRLIDGTD